MAEEIGTGAADWEIDINLSGVKAPSGGAAIVKGYYKVTIEGMAPLADKPNRLMITSKFPEGQKRNEFLNKPTSAEDNVRVYWRALCESVGYTPAQLDKGEVKLRAASFIGKTAHVFFDPEGNTYNGKVNPKTQFLAPAAWAEQKAAFEGKAENASNESKQSTNGVSKSTSSSMSEDEVRALLNA